MPRTQKKAPREPRADAWPHLQFAQDAGRKIPLPVRLIIAAVVLALIASAVGLWYSSRAGYRLPANPAGQPQARQLPPPSMPPPPPPRRNAIFGYPVRPNSQAPSQAPVARPAAPKKAKKALPVQPSKAEPPPAQESKE